MSAEREATLRAEILERVRELGRLREASKATFVPGQTPVPYAGRVYGASELENLADATLEFWLTAGRYHDALERALAQSYALRFARLVNSGSSANLVAVSALTSPSLGPRRLLPGDEVLTVAAGFPTTVTPLLHQGLVPVFVDISLPTANVDVAQLSAARSSRTRAVMLAHTLGNPFDLDAVSAFCQQHGLWLIEDNCDASGSLYRGRRTGTFGDLATLSFYPPHHITTGEGGAVMGKDPALAKLVESFRDWGRDCWCASGKDNTCGKRFEWQLGELPEGYDHKYVYSHLGFNLKMTDLQASVGLAQLARLEAFGEARRGNWAHYRAAFDDLADVFILPEATAGADPSWFGFLLVLRQESGLSRGELVKHLEAQKIQTRMLFGGNLTRQPAFTQALADAKAAGRAPPFRVATPLTVTDQVMERGLWIGVYPGLTPAMRDHVVAQVRAFLRRPERVG